MRYGNSGGAARRGEPRLAVRMLMGLLWLLTAPWVIAAPATISFTPPPQTSYTVPVSFELNVTSSDGMQGSSVETIHGVKILRNEQVAATGLRGIKFLESGLAPGTYTYYAQATAISIYRDEERQRTLRTQPFTITVNPPPPLYNEAEFVSQSFPDGVVTMYSGQTLAMSVQMRNTGTTTWSSSRAYSLGTLNPQDNTYWGMGRVGLPHDVAPGQSVTFNMTLTAPVVSSRMINYNVQWRMVQDGVEWFGQTSPNRYAYVSPVPAGTIHAEPNPCELIASATSCGTTVSWTANTAGSELWRSRIDGSGATRLIGVPQGDSRLNVADITEAGSRIEVRGDNRVLASIDVYARRPPPVITGNIDGLTADKSVLIGWACASTRQTPVDVHLYAGGPAGTPGAVFIGAYTANQASEAGVVASCKVDSGNFRFAIPISNEVRAQYSGRLIYVHGISPVGGANLAIGNSGGIAIPSPQTPVQQPNTRRYVYDQHQQLCKFIEPETGATVMAYDGAGNLTSSASGLNLPATDNCNTAEAAASGRVVARGYDALNRLKTLAFPDGRGNQSWEYTPDGQPSRVVTYNESGNAAAVENTYTYNKRRLLIGEAVAQPGWYRWDLGYGYDRLGNPASQVYPTGLAVTFEPDALGRSKRVSSPGAVYASDIEYYPNGALQRFVYGNGVVHTMAQNLRQLPQRSTDAGVIDLENVYDGNGNVNIIYDRARGDHYSRTMEYDGLDRLKSAGSCSFGGDCWHRFTYDAQDNLRSWILPGVKDYAAYVYDEHSRLTNIRNSANESIVGLGYDVQGNLENKNGQIYRFDYGNRLREVVGKEAYRYDGLGRRVASFSGGNQQRLLSQYNKAGQPLYMENKQKALDIVNVYLQGSLLASREKAQDTGVEVVRYQHTDSLGSPVAVSNERGEVLSRAIYEPYGNVIEPSAYDGIGYAGHIMDAATTLVQMQQRYYDPALGRFLSVDPVVVGNKTAGNFNRYSYANDNPYKFIDPDGRAAIVTRLKDGTIQVDIPAKFKGTGASEGNISKVKAQVQGLSGKYKVNGQDTQVNFRVTDITKETPNDAKNTITLTDGPTSRRGGLSYAVLGGKKAEIDIRDRFVPNGTAPHELLHLADVDDRYDTVTRKSDPAWGNNIMNVVPGVLEGRNIPEILNSRNNVQRTEGN
ncbi:RHS repeat domain-containing protein [Lysobacter gummosus]|uniref:RHS repeat domain-containing protein n=1 Tax=Lysobacter gummosus TaxID=262324 RepID=UPI0036D83CA1